MTLQIADKSFGNVGEENTTHAAAAMTFHGAEFKFQLRLGFSSRWSEDFRDVFTCSTGE
jgi:hypothetical protein